MEIYIEYLILDNLSANACIVWATLYAVKRLRTARVITGSVVACVIGVIYPLLNLNVLGEFLFRILGSVVIITFCDFGSKFVIFFKEWVLFYIFSFIFGGFLTAILNMLKVQPDQVGLTFLLIVGGVFTVIIVRCACVIFRTRSRATVDVEIGKSRVRGAWDSGNLLRTLDGKPVHVISPDVEVPCARDTGRVITVTTVHGTTENKLMTVRNMCVFDDEKVVCDVAYFVYASRALVGAKVVLNEGIKLNYGGRTDEKLFSKAN